MVLALGPPERQIPIAALPKWYDYPQAMMRISLSNVAAPCSYSGKRCDGCGLRRFVCKRVNQRRDCKCTGSPHHHAPCIKTWPKSLGLAHPSNRHKRIASHRGRRRQSRRPILLQSTAAESDAFLPLSVVVLRGGVNLAKPQRFHKRAAHGSFPIQHVGQWAAIQAVAFRKGAYSSFLLDCRSQQENNVPVVQYERATSHPPACEQRGDFKLECDWSFFSAQSAKALNDRNPLPPRALRPAPWDF
jgi:hypothetical protein